MFKLDNYMCDKMTKCCAARFGEKADTVAFQEINTKKKTIHLEHWFTCGYKMSMEWICKLVEPPGGRQQEEETEQNISLSLLSLINNTAMNNTSGAPGGGATGPEPQQQQQHEVMSWTFLEYSTHVLIPLLCVIGILGNLLNMTILGKRIKEGMDFKIIIQLCL